MNTEFDARGLRRWFFRQPLLMVLLATGYLCSLETPALRAAEPLRPGQGWATAELGCGLLDRSTPGFSDNHARFYFGLEGGLALNAQVLLGLECSGWLVQPGDLNDGTKGSGISQIFAVTRLYPQPGSPFHVQLGAGSVTGWDNTPGGARHNGTGWEVGIGYDRMISTHGAVTPFVRYTSGKAGNLKLNAVTFGVGFTWR